MLLLSLGVEKRRVTEMTGLCARSVHKLKKEMENGDIERQFKVETGRQGKRKLQDKSSRSFNLVHFICARCQIIYKDMTRFVGRV